MAAECTIGQLQAAMSPEQWQALSDAVAASDNTLLSFYFANPANSVPEDSPYVLEIAAQIGLDAAAVAALVEKAAGEPQN